MLTTITCHVVFEAINPATLFRLYTNAEQHQAFTGAPAIITERAGETFSAYGGFCFGKNIYIEKNKLILQTWKSQGWAEELEPSLVSIRLLSQSGNTHLYLTHADIPKEKAADMLRGWEEWYWTPIRKYLSIHHTD